MEGLDESQVQELIQWLIDQAVGGVQVAGHQVLASAENLAASFRTPREGRSLDDAIDELIAWETGKSFTIGFVTGLGGALALPVTIPADMAASWVIQARMAAAIALLRGFNLDEERVRTFILMALVADSMKEVLAQVGIKVGEKIAMRMVQEIPRTMLVAINKAVGFRLVTKLGQKGIVQLGKLVPLAGGVVGGTIDATACLAVGMSAKALFSEDKPAAEAEPVEPPTGVAV